MKAVLCLVLSIFILQYVVLYLHYKMYRSLSDRLENVASNLGLQENDITKTQVQTALRARRIEGERTQAVIYSYYGVDSLPSSDMISDVLEGLPSVLYVKKPLRYTSENFHKMSTKTRRFLY